MSNSGTSVRRGASGTPHGNTVVYRNFVLYFQRYPGTDASSGIQDVDYTFTVAGREVKRGKTGNDGNVTLQLPAGAKGILQIFSSEYEIRLRGSIEARNTMHGIQRRLSMLGYELGGIDGDLGRKTDRAILNFQADNNPLVIDGTAGQKTQNQLRTKVGE